LPERWRPFGDPGMNFGQRAWADMAECSLALIVQRYAVVYVTLASVTQANRAVNDAAQVECIEEPQATVTRPGRLWYNYLQMLSFLNSVHRPPSHRRRESR
jgi:hypothetical protein